MTDSPSEKLFQKNWNALIRSYPEKIEQIRIDTAKRIRDSHYESLQQGNRWVPGEYTIRCPEIIAHKTDFIDRYRDVSSQFVLDGQSIKQYFDVPGGDPHLLQNIVSLYEAIPDEFKTNTVSGLGGKTGFHPYFIVVRNPGCGIELQHWLKILDVKRLLVAVPTWTHLVASFWFADWVKIWSSFGKDKITIGRYSTVSKVSSLMAVQGLTVCDFSLLYDSATDIEVEGEEVVDPSLRLNIENLSSQLQRAINYLGFTLDEYNMILNTVGSLCSSPKIYRAPSDSLGGQCVVVGSGPSLDDSLHHLKELQKNHTIISCASNFRTLLANGIRVDVLVLLERALYNYEQYKACLDDYPSPNTILVASTTCAPEIHKLFQDRVVFYRPALTPLSIFSMSPKETLFFEGPQTINAGISLAYSLGADSILLVGVDLGTVSKSKARSEQALGDSPREFDTEYPGNRGENVFTNRSLLDGAQAVEFCIDTYETLNSSTKIWNSGCGIKIRKVPYISLNDYSQEYSANATFLDIKSWVDKLHSYSYTDLDLLWNSKKLRLESSLLINSLMDAVNSSEPWYPDKMLAIGNLLHLDCPIQKQIPRRIIRGGILKLVFGINRQIIYMSNHKVAQQEYLEYSLDVLRNLFNILQGEIYALCDHIDTSIFTTTTDGI